MYYITKQDMYNYIEVVGYSEYMDNFNYLSYTSALELKRASETLYRLLKEEQRKTTKRVV